MTHDPESDQDRAQPKVRFTATILFLTLWDWHYQTLSDASRMTLTTRMSYSWDEMPNSWYMISMKCSFAGVLDRDAICTHLNQSVWIRTLSACTTNQIRADSCSTWGAFVYFAWKRSSPVFQVVGFAWLSSICVSPKHPFHFFLDSPSESVFYCSYDPRK